MRIRLGGLGWTRRWADSEHCAGILQETPLVSTKTSYGGKAWPGSGCHAYPMLHGRKRLLDSLQLLLYILWASWSRMSGWGYVHWYLHTSPNETSVNKDRANTFMVQELVGELPRQMGRG